MTTERPESGQNRVKISVNAKGEAQVEVLVYADSSVPVTGIWHAMTSSAELAAFTKDKIESEIRKNGGRVAGDALKGGA
jgi:hypothetical protein